MKNISCLLLLIMAAAFISSCKKGAAGEKGEPGPSGNANVIYSQWITAKNFRDTTADNSLLKAADLPAPELTTSVLNNASMVIYFNFGGGIYALPYTSYAGNKLNTISFLPRIGHFIITRFTADNSRSVPLATTLQYRYVIIPGGLNNQVAQKVDINNYESVRNYYHITN